MSVQDNSTNVPHLKELEHYVERNCTTTLWILRSKSHLSCADLHYLLSVHERRSHGNNIKPLFKFKLPKPALFCSSRKKLIFLTFTGLTQLRGFVGLMVVYTFTIQ